MAHDMRDRTALTRPVPAPQSTTDARLGTRSRKGNPPDTRGRESFLIPKALLKRDVVYIRRQKERQSKSERQRSDNRLVRFFQDSSALIRWFYRHRVGLGPWYIGGTCLIGHATLAGLPNWQTACLYGLATLSGALAWYRHRMVRNGVRVERVKLHGMVRRRATRVARRIVRSWDVHMRNADMVGTTLVGLTFDEWSMTMDLRTTHRHGTKEIRKKLEVLERCFDGTRFTVRRGSGRVEPFGDHARAVRVRFMLADPHAVPIRPPVPDGTSHLVPIGLFETGTEVLINILQHLLIAGRTNAGKSTLLQVIIRALTHIPWVAVIGLDMKPGAPELGRWDGKLAYIGRNASDAQEVLNALIDGLEARGQLMNERGWQKWKPTREEPHIVLIVDEAQEISEAGLRDELSRVAALLRAYGGTLILATQYPKDSNLPSTVLQQMTQTIGLKTKNSTADRVIFGQDADRDGWTPHKLEIHKFLIQSDDYTEPCVAKGFYLDDDDLPRAVAEAPSPTQVDHQTLPLSRPNLRIIAAEDDSDIVEAEILPEDALARVYAALNFEETHRTDIERFTGLTQKTVDKYLAQLIAEGRAVKVRRAVYRKVEMS